MLYTLGVLFFAIGLLLSIALHEIGHMVPAKKFGVKVTQYMVGFGPTLWSRKRGDTEYGLKAVPLGGYIRMIGMVPPKPDGSRSRWPRRLAVAVEDFRSASRSEVVDEVDEPRQFYRLTPGKKIVVMLGGPTMNLIIYLLLTVLLFTVVGKSHSDPTLSVGSVTQCVVPQNSADAKANTCPANAVAAPATNVLKAGDTMLAINGTKLTSWQQEVDIIQASAGKALSVTIERAGTEQTVTITPVENLKYDATGTKLIHAGFIGIAPTYRNYFVRESITQIPGEIGSQLRQAVDALGSYPSKIESLWQTVFDGKPRDPAGAVGVVGLGEIGGQVANSNQIDVTAKIYSLLGLLASVNLLLFLFNLLPLLPLDGGHVAGALVEAVKRGRARLHDRRRPRTVGPDGAPGPRSRSPIYVDTAQMLPVMYAVASVLIVLTLLVVYADIVKPIHLN